MVLFRVLVHAIFFFDGLLHSISVGKFALFTIILSDLKHTTPCGTIAVQGPAIALQTVKVQLCLGEVYNSIVCKYVRFYARTMNHKVNWMIVERKLSH